MKLGRILEEMRSGTLHETYRERANRLKKKLTKSSDIHLTESTARSLLGFLQTLRYAYILIAEDYYDVRWALQLIDGFALPADLMNLERFKKLDIALDHLLEAHVTTEMKSRLKGFTPIEIFRLDEALITVKNEAYLSSIVMSVSAAESRLHKIVKQRLPRQYKKDSLDKAPLGTLLNQINSNKKYKTIRESLSEKFPSLLSTCNSYRVFSAHPKQEVMTYQEALAIFQLVFSFLIGSK